MEHAKEIIEIIFNSKVGIIIAITISVILILAYFFSKTSIGRKALFELRAKAQTTKSYAETTKDVVVEELKKAKEDSEIKLKLYEETFNEFRKEMFEVLKFVPNAKVKKFVQEHENINLKELVKESENHSQNG